jgi:anthranilate phosphoribosyltransferase
VLGKLFARRDLTPTEAEAALSSVLEGEATNAQIAAFVAALRAKGETVEEMAAFVRTMLAFAELVDVPAGVEPVDTCGTGGDRRATINVSTIAALVVAGAGVPVLKHGGRAASSQAGSADVLEALGVEIELGPAGVVHCLERAGMAFCFAPRFHPAMRHAAPVRRELGVPTVFNLLGPLANPGRTRRQLVGVADPVAAEKVALVLRANGAERAMVVFGHDGLDELTTTSTSTVIEIDGAGPPRRYDVDPSDLGLSRVALEDLRGGDAAANAAAVRRVLGGEPGPMRDVVVLNAAAGLVVGGAAADLAEGLEQAGRAIDEGRAAAVLERLVACSREAASLAGGEA